MSSGKPTRDQADLAEVLELVLDKGIVINADIAVTVGETELLGIELRAAIASFETAAKYGLAFPSGTDMRRVERASGREPLEDDDEPIDLGIDASSGGSREDDESDGDGGSSRAAAAPAAPSQRPTPQVPTDDDDGGEGSSVDDADQSGDGDGEGPDAAPDESGSEDGSDDDGDGQDGSAADSSDEESASGQEDT
ncbi:gas vesicle protein [Natronomonas salina]|uniref:gas vesicle protein GvpJ n=1 Tax=Natronomonas salina TaxID=1710540 RepID=UPI0015B5B217|nr:gas vesicle protein [Natronomonas salina]QLD90576.1 gas vesicle protein [Natronomonas salina]